MSFGIEELLPGVIASIVAALLLSATVWSYRKAMPGLRRMTRKSPDLKRLKGRIGNYSSDFRVINWFATWTEGCPLSDVSITVAGAGHPVENPDPPDGVAREAWQSRIAEVRASLNDPQKEGHDGEILRVRSLQTIRDDDGTAERERLTIVCEPVRYSAHRVRMEHVRGLPAARREDIQERFLDGHQTPLSGAIAVNVLIRTEDNYLLFAQRGARVHSAKRKFTCGIDEMLTSRDMSNRTIQLSTVVARALSEELGIRARKGDPVGIERLVESIARLVSCEMRTSSFDFGIGVAIDLTKIQTLLIEPDLMEMARAKFSREAISRNISLSTQGDTVEIADIEFVPLQPDSIKTAFSADPDRYDDSAYIMAAVALHGLAEYSIDRIEKAFL